MINDIDSHKTEFIEDCSIIIPIYNERDHIKNVLAQINLSLKNHFINYEVIVIDDGSIDGSGDILKNEEGIKLISHTIRQGYGSAIKTGIKNSKHDTIVIIDGGDTYPTRDIPKLVRYLKDSDMVVGMRTGKVVKIPFIRRPIKYLLGQLANYLSETKIPDLNSGFRVFKKNIVEKFSHILPNGFSFTTTITLAMHSEGYRIRYVPINYFKRKGKSKINPLRDTLNFIQLIIRTILYFNPLKIFLPVSMGLFLVAFLLLLYRIFITRAFGTLIVILFVSAIQVLAIGMLADLINRKIK